MSKAYEEYLLLPALRAITSQMAENGWQYGLATETRLEGNLIITTSQLVWYKHGKVKTHAEFEAEAKATYENRTEN